jgi:hypothetical protein
MIEPSRGKPEKAVLAASTRIMAVDAWRTM